LFLETSVPGNFDQTVVNRHGGAMLVKSRPGETTFQVRRPLMPRTPANAAAP